MKFHITNKIIYDVIIMMVGFGIITGIVFPHFIIFMGIPEKSVLHIKFFIYCIFAGILVAFVNIAIVKLFIIRRIGVLSQQMKEVKNTVEMSCTTIGYKCEPNGLLLKEDSDDELGESVKSFNSLVITLSNALKFESEVRAFSILLSKQMEVDAMAKDALKFLMKYLCSEGGMLLYKLNGKLKVLSFYGIEVSENITQNNIIEKVIQQGKMCIMDLKDQEMFFKESKFEHIPHSIVVQPIISEGINNGIIILSKNTLFTKEELNKLDTLSIGLSLALTNAMAHGQLQELAIRDPLTCAYNRRSGIMRLNQELERSVKEGYPLSIIMIDIDYFKTVNDSHGHQAGDLTLTYITKLICDSIRETDMLVRYGGEEFLCILPGADLKSSYEIAERTRKKVMNGTLHYNNSSIKVTISAGVVSYPETNSQYAEILVNKADKLMYEAKKSGRNRIIA